MTGRFATGLPDLPDPRCFYCGDVGCTECQIDLHRAICLDETYGCRTKETG